MFDLGLSTKTDGAKASTHYWIGKIKELMSKLK